ncbi:MAG: hypothetical protein HYZ54_09140 [Ignavibacteriae bacterium]|nr:hypothetical protein [Ignavibacteriota bacterium]
MIKKQNIPIRTISFIIAAIFLIFFLFKRSRNKYYDLLSSDKTRVSIATIYGSRSGKSVRWYHFIYKANGVYYTGELQSNQYIDRDKTFQSFYLVYRLDDPAINVPVYQKPIKLNFQLDTVIQPKYDLALFIKRNTLENGDGNIADRQDFEEISKYIKRRKRLKLYHSVN